MSTSGLPDFDSQPLVAWDVAEVLFAVQEPAEQAELKSMLVDMKADVIQRLTSATALVETLDAAGAKQRFHPLKGNAASFGFARSAAILGHLELRWDEIPFASRGPLILRAAGLVADGAAQLAARYPYLA